jgi:hypothetical protein
VPGTPPFAPEPGRGRVFEGSRLVRATDATVTGRLRLDGLARFLQDVAEDDVADTGWQPPYGWLLRRCAVIVREYPRVTGRVTLRTFCSGTGPRWAERTTTVLSGGAAVIQAVAVWVAVDHATGQLRSPGDDFCRFYGAAAQGRRVSARLELPGPDGGQTRADPPRQALLEYHRPILAADRPVLRSVVVPPSPGHAGHTAAWLTDAGGKARYASARLPRISGTGAAPGPPSRTCI